MRRARVSFTFCIFIWLREMECEHLLNLPDDYSKANLTDGKSSVLAYLKIAVDVSSTRFVSRL